MSLGSSQTLSASNATSDNRVISIACELCSFDYCCFLWSWRFSRPSSFFQAPHRTACGINLENTSVAPIAQPSDCRVGFGVPSDYGMPSTQPTCFATWRMKSFDHQLQQGLAACPEHLIQALFGRNADGSFKTAIAKEYPGLLCSVIAKTMGDFGRACDIECDIDERSPSNATQNVSFNALTRLFLVPLLWCLRLIFL